MLMPLNYLMNKYNFWPTGVLHVGASEGQERNDYLRANIWNVIWVEAIPEVYEALCNNVKDIEGSICINACVSDRDGQIVEFNISSHGKQSSSMFEFGTHVDAHPEVSFIDKIKLKTNRLDSLLKDVDMTAIDFLNCDLQGSELLAIKGMGDMLQNFKWAYIEVNKRETYKGCALVDEIDDYMKTFGFERVETSAWIGDTWADAFYIKKSEYDRS